ncbi:segregation and condensation protein A [Anaerotalea alkaliphila]|uniref:Segregation and condensation protein A n=1 Tax=Anaerotalea alkaliphila TaxID=2662126 RepID=A0A7X5HTB8_9FIRM|nr:segregation/condensation protein A [Anaerotalea alkaliphila]NDL66292.1 segregation/condensation protein A [Anaerotalea alkaliphila]
MELSYKLEIFEGPLDLLLHLVEKNKVDISEIPIALVAGQYLEHVREMGDCPMEVMSGFLEMAATLIYIKTKMLLPRHREQEGEAGLSAEEEKDALVARLLEYKKFKTLAKELADMQEAGGRHFYKSPSLPAGLLDDIPRPDPQELLAGLAFADLYKVFCSLLRQSDDRVDPVRSGFGKIRKESHTVHEKMEELLAGGKRGVKRSFREILAAEPERMGMIVLFLAVLELVKGGRIQARQSDAFDDILIEYL